MSEINMLPRLAHDRLFLPNYVQQARLAAALTGSVTAAAAVLFREARLAVEVIGGTRAWTERDRPTIFVGDHRNGHEFAPLLAIFGAVGRNDVHFIAKPFSRNARILRAVAPRAESLVLPVIPRTLSSDRVNIFNRDLGWRLLNAGTLPTRAQLGVGNAATLSKAASLLATGHLVNIFPCGGIMNALHNPWRNGLGEIVKLLPEGLIPETRVVLYRFDDFRAAAVGRALIMRSHGIRPRRECRITLRIGADLSLAHALQGLGKSDMTGAKISNVLRQKYVDVFADYR